MSKNQKNAPSILFILCCMACVLTFGIVQVQAVRAAEGRDWSALKFTYQKPAPNWTQASPIGNGRIGAKIFGNVKDELLQFNEVTLWSGGPRDCDNPKGPEALTLCRKALFEGRFGDALKYCYQMQGFYNESFEPMADLHLDFDDADNATDYYRELDLDRAVVALRYRVGETRFQREYFASYPDQVVVMRISGEPSGKVAFTAALSSQLHFKVLAAGNDGLTLKGKAPMHVAPHYQPVENPIVYDSREDGKGMNFQCDVRIIADGGTVSAVDGKIRVSGANSAVLIFSAATSFNGSDKEPGTQGVDPSILAKANLEKAAAKPFAQLLDSHVRDYQGLFRRVWLELGGHSPPIVPMDEESDESRPRERGGPRVAGDPSQAALAYQYSRYQTIACSRPGGQPETLKGIWNADVRPRWSSNYTLNENTEKNYNHVESGNIAECAEPLIDLIADLARHGQRTAQVVYGCRGWVAHHNTDLWRTTAAVGEESGDPKWANWPVGGIWLCQNLWEHYAFSGDKEFLRTRAYPIMKGAAEFALDWLIEGQGDYKGYLVTAPSVSPELQYIGPDGGRYSVSIASTMDMALIRELFTNCIAASKELGIDADFSERLEKAQARLYPYKIGARGQLQEWSKDYAEVEPTHRHISGLIGVWPLNQITPRGTPDLFAAARRSMDLRENGGGMPDKPGMLARLREADRAAAMLSRNGPSQFMSPFGGFAELLVQSHASDIELLPALPTSWKQGDVDGLRARGGFVLAMKWNNSRLERASLTSQIGKPARVRTAVPVNVTQNGKPVTVAHPEPHVVEFATEASKVYDLSPLPE